MRKVVIVPTYNEADNLEQLTGRLIELQLGLEVLIVDDSSPDGSGEIADRIASGEPRVHVIRRSGKRGYARASREAMLRCLSEEFDCIATMDADLSHDPASLTALCAAIDEGADVAIGSRYVRGGRSEVDWGIARRAVSRVGSAYARVMIGTHVCDCTSGFRCYRAEVLRDVPLDQICSEGYSFLIELLARLTDRGARVVEVPITYVDRRAGQSKISSSIIVEALWRTTLLGVARIAGLRRRDVSKARVRD